MLLLPFGLSAQEYPIPTDGKRLIGENIFHRVEKGDYFQLLAEKYNVGFYALLAANQDVDPFLPPVGSTVLIPKQMLLPYGKHQGIIINLPEMRLYYFTPEQKSVHVFPVGIGREGLKTPNTTSYIGEKRKNPVWRPPQAMKDRYLKEKGITLADEVPAGPNNPFGKYALRISTSEFLIHGTNQRFGIGMRSSSGCIRMYDQDIEWLYHNVEQGTPIKIINQAVKISYENYGTRLLEVHEPLSGKGEQEELETVAVKAKADRQINRLINKHPEWQSIIEHEVAKPTGLVTWLDKHSASKEFPNKKAITQ